jgi:hypothetical protein
MTDAGPGASGAATGASPEPGGKSSGAGSEPGGQGSSGADKTYTQEQLDRFLNEERRRNQTKYGDYDEIKSKLTTLEGASQSELEKANAKAQEAAASAQKATARADGLLIRSAITAEAARAGAIDPDVVVALLVEQFSVKDDAVEGDVTKAVAKLLEQRPYLRSANGPARIGSADAGRHTPPGKQATETPAERMDDVLRGSR